MEAKQAATLKLYHAMAEEAGMQMKKTRESTEELVESVRKIAQSSIDQARVTNDLQGRANQIRESTKKTSEQLQEQTIQTKRLAEFSRGLLRAVQVFKLPGGDKPVTKTGNNKTESPKEDKPVVDMAELKQRKAS